MRRVLAIAAVVLLASPAGAGERLKRQLRHDKVAKASKRHLKSLQEAFEGAGAAWPPRGVLYRAFKRDMQLELWAAPKQGERWVRVLEVPFCKLSGKLGPKVKQGDRQVPEGAYHVRRFDPREPFHLGLLLDHPNKADWARSGKASPGGKIRIHGGCVTSGCIPVGDEAVEPLYLAGLLAHDAGQEQVPVRIYPCRFGQDACEAALRSASADRRRFWDGLRPIFEAFERDRVPPEVEVTRKGYRLVPAETDHE